MQLFNFCLLFFIFVLSILFTPNFFPNGSLQHNISHFNKLGVKLLSSRKPLKTAPLFSTLHHSERFVLGTVKPRNDPCNFELNVPPYFQILRSLISIFLISTALFALIASTVCRKFTLILNNYIASKCNVTLVSHSSIL